MCICVILPGMLQNNDWFFILFDRNGVLRKLHLYDNVIYDINGAISLKNKTN